MSLQTIINTYRQNIYRTHAEPNATAELSLHTHLQDFLEETAAFLTHDITIIHEPRKLEIGRPDFVVQDGLLHVGYVEAEAYETELDRLTGHAKTQNDRFIENLDNFVLTNFVEFRLYTEGTLRAKASLTGAQENDEELGTLLDRFLGAHPISLANPRGTRKLPRPVVPVNSESKSQRH